MFPNWPFILFLLSSICTIYLPVFYSSYPLENWCFFVLWIVLKINMVVLVHSNFILQTFLAKISVCVPLYHPGWLSGDLGIACVWINCCCCLWEENILDFFLPLMTKQWHLCSFSVQQFCFWKYKWKLFRPWRLFVFAFMRVNWQSIHWKQKLMKYAGLTFLWD